MIKREEYLAVKRKEKGLSVADLAKELNVSEWEIERWESGELPDSQHLLKLSEVLDISVDDILRGGNEFTDDADFKSGDFVGDVEIDGVCRPELQKASDFNVKEGADAGESPRQSSQAQAAIPNGRNGYYPAERKFGYFVFAVFIIAVMVLSSIQFVNWLGRPRELTVENYKDYIEIEVEGTRNYNPDEYIVRITAKEDISDLNLSIKVRFNNFVTEDQFYTVTFNGNLEKNGYLENTVHLSSYAIYYGYELLNVNGGLA